MEVQAQYPSNAFTIPDFRKATAARGENLLDGHHNQIGNHLLSAYYGSSPLPHLVPSSLLPNQALNGNTVFSEPESELTCNASGSRKRTRREDHPVDQTALLPQQQPQIRLAPLPPKSATPISTGLQLTSYEGLSRRLNENDMTSTSGRPPAGGAAAASSPIVSPLAQDIASLLYQQSLEVDALIRLQHEKLRSGMEEANKRHCRALLTSVEQQIIRRLREKEAELETAHRRNVELEEKVRQMTAENHIWFNVARNNEAVASSLRTTLEQVLLQNAAAGAAIPTGAPAPPAEEGYGDSEGSGGAGPMYAADDAQSCCFDESEAKAKAKAKAKVAEGENREMRRRRSCKVCGEGEVSVLLLPCRHLCLCKSCESRLDSCPICNSVKNASLQIFMSS